MRPELDRNPLQTQAMEKGTAWAILPIAATLGYYVLPTSFQQDALVQFAPQILAYLAFFIWTSRNTDVLSRLGLEIEKVADGLRLGTLTGLLLGCLNTLVILFGYPTFGHDILFLRTTPHGQFPPLLMVPWVIVAIALFVELNFRGFLLGRLALIEARWWTSAIARRVSPLALLGSTLTFAFDPFMVNTFRHLHWIAVWDGLIWATLWLRTRNLYITIIAHTVEVILMYSVVRTVIG
jgi:hypothetical protein